MLTYPGSATVLGKTKIEYTFVGMFKIMGFCIIYNLASLCFESNFQNIKQ